MKKIFLTLALGVATITFAQQMDRPAKMDPEQRKAEMQKKQQEHLDKMSKDLNLSQDQVKKSKIYKINKWQICKKICSKERWKEKPKWKK
jgi:Ni/Co efflux regulator RcnB